MKKLKLPSVVFASLVAQRRGGSICNCTLGDLGGGSYRRTIFSICMGRRNQGKTPICEICEQRRRLNRHGICLDCAKAMDLSTSGNDATAVFTASHTLKDLLPYADKDLDAPQEWFRRNK